MGGGEGECKFEKRKQNPTLTFSSYSAGSRTLRYLKSYSGNSKGTAKTEADWLRGKRSAIIKIMESKLIKSGRTYFSVTPGGASPNL